MPPPGPRELEMPSRINMRALWRLTGWGVAAALALGMLAFTTQTYTGSQRLKLAFTPAEMPVRPVAVVKVPPPPPTNEAEMARLQAEVNVLAADRDRLTTPHRQPRAQPERLTGSIKRLTTSPALAAAAEPAPKPTPPQTVAAPAAPPADAPHEQSEAKAAEPAALGPPQEVAAPPSPAPPEAAPAPAVPLPPVRVAALPPKPEFGFALAGASNIDLTCNGRR